MYIKKFFHYIAFMAVISFLILSITNGATVFVNAQDENAESETTDESEIIQYDQNFEQKPISIHLFFSQTCGHCSNEIEFLKQYASENPEVNVYYYEVNRVNSRYILQNATNIIPLELKAVPITIIGEWTNIGFDLNSGTDQLIKEHAESYNQNEEQDIVKAIIAKGGDTKLFNDEEIKELKESLGINDPQIENQEDDPNTNPSEENNDSTNVPEEIENNYELPIVGNIKLGDISLLSISIILGIVDGFNPCAMWTLLFLISLLLSMNNKKRMWLLGITFIVASAFIYFVFMAAWLNVFLVIGIIPIVTSFIGIFALLAGIYSLFKVFLNKQAGCETSQDERRLKVFDSLTTFTHKSNILIALAGITMLAFAVNTIEIMCSLGLPALFTNILSLNDLPLWQYYGYIIVYIIFFMIDDIVIFIVAMITLQAIGIETRYGRYSRIISSIIMILIGILLLTHPEILSFR